MGYWSKNWSPVSGRTFRLSAGTGAVEYSGVSGLPGGHRRED